MELLRHAYTNRTGCEGAVVVKSYRGPDAARRRFREESVLRALKGRMPVPAVIHADEGALSMEFLDGEHGQDLLRGERAARVLQACGHTLRRLHAFDVTTVFGPEPTSPGTVVVHGDYGPNNILLDSDSLAVTAVLDWEWAHPGDPFGGPGVVRMDRTLLPRRAHRRARRVLRGVWQPSRVAATAPADGRPGAGAGGVH